MVSPILIAILIIVTLIMVVLIILFIRSRRTVITTTSFPSRVPCNGPPTAPTNLSASILQADTIVLRWLHSAGALSYTAYLAESPNFNPANALQTRTTNNNSVGFGNLELGVNYHFRIKATNSCGDSPLSSEISFVLPFSFPRRFMIQNKLNPDLKLCDVHDNPFGPSDRVAANRFCSTATSLAFYQSRDQTIRQIDRPDRCLTRTNNPNSIFFNPCVTGDQNQTWQYSTQTNNLCGVGENDVTGTPNDCINLSPNFTPEGGLLSHGTPVNDVLSDWLITPA